MAFQIPLLLLSAYGDPELDMLLFPSFKRSPLTLDTFTNDEDPPASPASRAKLLMLSPAQVLLLLLCVVHERGVLEQSDASMFLFC